MRKIILLVFLTPCLLVAQRRLNNPQQFAFGPWTSVYPFNNNSGFNDIPNDAQQPSALITNTEAFGSTSDFTAVGAGCSSQTFSVSGNVGTISASAASTCVYLVNGTSWPAPDAMIPLTIDQVGIAATSDTLGVGLCKNDGSVQILAQYDQVNGNAQANVFVSSAYNPLSAVVLSTPVGSSIALGLESTSATVFYGSSSGGWSMATSASTTSLYNPNTDGNLTGFESCFVVSTGAATTTSWQVSNLVSGAGGAPTFATNTGGAIFHGTSWIDGRSYVNGTKYYFASTLIDAPDAATSEGLIAYDLSTGKASIVAKYWTDWSGALNYFGTPALLYDNIAAQYRWMVAAWGVSNPPNIYYGTVAQGTLGMFSPGVHVIPSTDMTEMTLSSAGWDPSLLCLSWNGSTDNCPEWYLPLTASTSTTTDLYTSTSDPSVNSWTHVGFSGTPAHSINEGSQIWRTRASTGSSGVTFDALFSLNCCSLSSGGNIPASQISSLEGSPAYVGTAPLTPPTTASDSSGHLPVFEFGDQTYALSWNDSAFGKGPVGQLAMAAASEAITAPQMKQVTYVANSGATAVASITSPAVSISSGCYLVFGTGLNSSGLTGITITSSPAATWTQVSYYNGGSTHNGLVISTASLPAGSTTFTSTPNVSAQDQGMVVMQLTGTTCTADSTAQTNTNVASGSAITVNSISTSQPDLAVMCTWSAATNLSLATYSLTGSQTPWIAYNNSSNTSGINANCAAGVIPAVVSGYSFQFSTFSTGVFLASSVVGIEFNTAAPSLPVPTFSAAAGSTFATQTVAISAASGATVCYTTDDSIPLISNGICQHGSVYSVPVSVNYGSSVMAVAWKLGFSPTVPAQYAYDSSKLIRGSTLMHSTSATVTLPFPSGSQVGDTCVIVVNSEVGNPTLSGWTQGPNGGGGGYAISFYYKNLTSADISAGSVSLSFGSSGNGTESAFDLYGSHTYETGNWGSYTSSTTNPVALSNPPLGSGLSGNFVLLASSTRSTAAGTINRATYQGTVSDGQRASTAYTATVLPTGYAAPVIYRPAGTFPDSCCQDLYAGWVAFSN